MKSIALALLVSFLAFTGVAADKAIHQLTPRVAAASTDLLPEDVEVSPGNWNNFYISLGTLAQFMQGTISNPVPVTYIVTNFQYQSYITNLNAVYIYNDYAYVTNLYTSNAFITNLYTTNIIDLSLTPDTLLRANGTNTINSIPNGIGVLTNDGSGGFGWILPIDVEFTGDGVITNLVGSLLTVTIPGATNVSIAYITNLYSSTSYITNLYSSNAFITNLYTTNITAQKITVNNLYSTTNYFQQTTFSTNQSTMAPDFRLGYAYIETNANFTFLLPIGFDGTGTNTPTTVLIVKNTLGTPISATAPVNVHVVPGSVMWITNATIFTWHNYPTYMTNVYAVPIF